MGLLADVVLVGGLTASPRRRTRSATRSHEPLQRRRARGSCQASRQPGKRMQGPLLDHDGMRAPWGERRSLESTVFAAKLPHWEGLGEAVIRCAGYVEGWVRGYGMVFWVTERTKIDLDFEFGTF